MGIQHPLLSPLLVHDKQDDFLNVNKGPDDLRIGTSVTMVVAKTTESIRKGYPSMVLYVDMLGLTLKMAGGRNYLLTRQGGPSTYASAHLISRKDVGVVAGQMRVHWGGSVPA